MILHHADILGPCEHCGEPVIRVPEASSNKDEQKKLLEHRVAHLFCERKVRREVEEEEGPGAA